MEGCPGENLGEKTRKREKTRKVLERYNQRSGVWGSSARALWGCCYLPAAPDYPSASKHTNRFFFLGSVQTHLLCRDTHAIYEQTLPSSAAGLVRVLVCVGGGGFAAATPLPLLWRGGRARSGRLRGDAWWWLW